MITKVDYPEEALKSLREEMKKIYGSFGELANRCKVGHSYVSQIFTGRARISNENIHIIEAAKELIKEEKAKIAKLNKAIAAIK